MSSYTDMTSTFVFKGLLTHQNMDALGENDNYLRDFISDYRRPVLKYVSATQMDIENNTGTSNETRIIFPDGTERSVTEDTSSAHKFRRFTITASAEYQSGTEDSGLYSAISEATDTWYAIYCVKSQINTANFILVGDTALPLQANFSTLNTRYGTDSWIYLGLIRNGDNSATTGDILEFDQTGNKTLFKNVVTGNEQDGQGIRLATTASATSLAYTYASGTGTTQIPDNATIAIYQGVAGAVADAIIFRADGLARYYVLAPVDHGFMWRVMISADEGLDVAEFAGTGAVAMDIYIAGYIDNVLGVSFNPLL